jgi:hypothetical protein
MLDVILALVAGVALIATLFLVWKLFQIEKETTGLRSEITSYKLANQKWQAAFNKLSSANDLALKAVQEEVAARKVAERQRDELLAEAAKNGNVKALAATVNKELDAIRIGFKKEK